MFGMSERGVATFWIKGSSWVLEIDKESVLLKEEYNLGTKIKSLKCRDFS